MADREKVVGHLYDCLAASRLENTWVFVRKNIVGDAIAMLKEQEAKSPVVREKNGYWDYVCPTCGSRDEELFREWNYCPFCGQAVKWNA